MAAEVWADWTKDSRGMGGEEAALGADILSCGEMGPERRVEAGDTQRLGRRHSGSTPA